MSSMFGKKKETGPVKISQSQANDLVVLIGRMQSGADQVEKNILRVDALLAEDSENGKRGMSLTRRIEAADNLSMAETLLKELFLDMDKVKKLQHPQAGEIELDVNNLHERWFRCCSMYRDLYKQSLEVDLTPKINWAQVLTGKQKQIEKEAFGPTLSDVEKQIAAHNITHKEIEAYRSQIDSSDPPTVKSQYSKLVESSLTRKHHLSTLYDYLQRCEKELAYLREQENQICKRDWSDRMVDPAGVRKEFERLKDTSLQAHESEIADLQKQTYRLVPEHPGSSTINTHNATVQKEWKKFRNLCQCQETHLDNVKNYKKFQLDAETISDSLRRINSSMEPNILTKMSNPQILMQLESEERAVQRNEQKLAKLKEASGGIAPLTLRRISSTRCPVVAICDWNTEKASVQKGEKYSLVSSPAEENWEVKSSLGEIKVVPGVCFVIPPPDPEAIDRATSLEQDLASLKRRRASLQSSLRTPTEEVVQVTKTVAVSRAPDDSKGTELASRLDKLNSDLMKLEKDVLARIRVPLDRRNPTADLSARLGEQERSALTLKNLQAEKASIERAMEPILSQKPLGPTTSSLPQKLSTANNKIEDIASLTDLYGKKADAAMRLENQLKKVDKGLTGLEDQLARNTVILDKPAAIQDKTRELQSLSKDATALKDDVQKLNMDLELTEQLCGHLQKSFQEHCPDVRHQQSDVRRLRNRYANINNELKQTLGLMQEAANKQQIFQSAVQSLNQSLNTIPNNKLGMEDSMTQITAKQNSQKRTVEDLKRKSEDVDRLVALSHELQNTLKEYETVSSMYHNNSSTGDTDLKKSYSLTLADAVRMKEKEAVKRYHEALAQNVQLLDQMDLAKGIVNEKESVVSRVAVQQQQLVQKDLVEVDSLKRELSEESSLRAKAESDLETYRKRMVSLKTRRGVERVEEKETVHYYRDPKLEVDLEMLKKKIEDEVSKHSGIRTEIEILKQRIVKMEHEVTEVKPKLVTKVFTEYEKDPQLEKEAVLIREEMQKIREELRLRETEVLQRTTEITFLEQRKPTIKERIVKKEVVKLEKDPEMLKAIVMFKNEISDEGIRCKNLNDEIFQIRSQINTLERIIPTVQPKIVMKELKKVEQDPELLRESKVLRTNLEEVLQEITILTKEVNSLQLQYSQVEKLKPKVDFKEMIHEIYRVDPETEIELRRLRKELQDMGRQRVELENKINLLMVDLKNLRSQKPKVETKETVLEVVKEERSPELAREISRLNEQLTRLRATYTSTSDQLNILRKERDEWKAEKSKIETTVVNRELIKYENDPLQEREAERLRKEVRAELQLRRRTEENVFDLQQKHIILERQKPEEKIVYQEVVRLEKDPKHILEHERLTKKLDEETKSRWAVETDVQKLRAIVAEKQKSLAQMDDRQKKILVETELRQIKSRILELESTPPCIEEKIIIEEVLKVERDPNIDTHMNGLRSDLDTESTKISNLERDIRNLKLRINVLTKEKSVEKTVYKEVIRVEKDQAVETERTRMREQVTAAKNTRRNKEDEIQRLQARLTRLQTTMTAGSKEESTLIQNRDALRKERDDLLRDLKRLETERQDITISFQQNTKLLSEKSQMYKLKSSKLDNDIRNLEKDILLEKDRINQREVTIIELQNTLTKEDHSEKHTRETTKTTRITILDPETGKDMSPYDAYLEGLIDRNHYLQLQTLECSWEEMTSSGPDGETTVLLDRKSGKKYSVQEALKEGKLTLYDVQQYRDGKIPISEFALMVAGVNKAKSHTSLSKAPLSPVKNTTSPLASSYNSTTRSQRSSLSSNGLLSAAPVVNSGEETFPICGILDTTTKSHMSVRSAMTRKLIDSEMAQKLLEAQAATGGIVDLNKKDRFSVHKAAERGLIDPNQAQKLLSAQKAFTGVEDPVTKQRLSVGEAAEKGWITTENARRYMEVQLLTGGLVNPNKAGRMNVQTAIREKIIDQSIASMLEDDVNHLKYLVDPITKKKITYKEAMALCKKDYATGLLLLPVASTRF
ncbi:envoplakin b [Brachyhypopomus gauderio]|uniref:envoplakin b n=1 Tax=Brachyhypopomus gauderio TaxID=698409 RepID=UPI00404177CF